MAIADSALPRFEIGRVMRRAFGVIGSNIATFALLSLIPGLSVGAVGDPFDDGSGGLVLPSLNILMIVAALSLFYLASGAALQGAVVHAAFASLSGRRASIGDCLATGLKYILPLSVIGLLATLAIIAGMLLLIVPGIMLAVMWGVVTPACVVEHTGVAGAFRRSRELTRGYRWPILGLYIVLLILMLISTVVVGVLIGILAGLSAALGQGVVIDPNNSTAVEMIASVINTMITLVLGSALAASVDHELRQIKEGVGPEALASVFD